MSTSEERILSQKDDLALVVAQGKSVAAWARQCDVPTSTAYSWTADPDFRRQVQHWRRQALDRAMGVLAAHTGLAVQSIAKLGETAESESVRLAANRAVLRDQFALGNYSEIEYRLSAIEVELRARNANAKRKP
jgi:hypothetical protein